MWSFVPQTGLATAVLDFTNDLSWLGIGLFGLVALAAGSITFMAIRHYLSQRSETVPEHYRKAA
jgi:hypothetical protein